MVGTQQHSLNPKEMKKSLQIPAARLVEVQIAFASVLLLNKIDQCEDFDALRPAIRAINSVQIFPCTYCEVSIRKLWAPAKVEPNQVLPS